MLDESAKLERKELNKEGKLGHGSIQQIIEGEHYNFILKILSSKLCSILRESIWCIISGKSVTFPALQKDEKKHKDERKLNKILDRTVTMKMEVQDP